MVPNRSRCQIDSFTLLVPNWLRCQIGTSAKLTPFTLLVPNWFRCQIDSFYTLGAKLTLLHSWCQIGSGAKLTLLNSWCQIGPVPNWLRCQIDSGAKLMPVPNCPLILLNERPLSHWCLPWIRPVLQWMNQLEHYLALILVRSIHTLEESIKTV